MDIPVMLLIIVAVFAFIVLLSWWIKRKRSARYTVSYKGKLLYKGKPAKLDDHEVMIGE